MKIIEGDGIVGTVFRFKDMYNYYTAEYFNGKLYFKSMVNG